MEAQVEALEEQVQAALINVNWCNSPYSDEEKAEGDAQVTLAQAELLAAQAEVDSWLSYPDPLDVAVAEAQVTSAEAALADAQETQLIVDLVAPIGGTVLNDQWHRWRGCGHVCHHHHRRPGPAHAAGVPG